MSKRILIAEDSPTQAQRAKLILESGGYEIIQAENGRIGLDKAITDQPDLIVSDIVMPEMDGYEMCAEIKSRPETKAIPIVMLTTKGDIMDIIKGLGVGADNFITKPYEGAYLLERVGEVFENLALRAAGNLPEEKELADFHGKVRLTTDRHQILSLLLSTVGVVIHCDVLGLFLISTGDRHSLFRVSLQPLADQAGDDLTKKVLAAANVLDGGSLAAEDVNLTKVVKEENLPASSATFRSFISVPLIHDGNVIGILTAANTNEDAFQPDDVKLLYQLGLESASAFDRIDR